MVEFAGMKPMIIAHRGASREAPENTVAAFRLAWLEGADGIEADFRLTLDGHLICIHDATTGRTAGVELEVELNQMNELRRLDVGIWKGDSWQGERLPLLEEVLQGLPRGKLFFIELKGGREMIPSLKSVLADHAGDTSSLRILTFDSGLVRMLKEELPHVKVCLNLALRWRPQLRSRQNAQERIIAALENCRADGLSCQSSPLLDARFVSELHKSGREVHVWTVDSARSAGNYLIMGVDSIMTNRPGWLRSRLY